MFYGSLAYEFYSQLLLTVKSNDIVYVSGRQLIM